MGGEIPALPAMKHSGRLRRTGAFTLFEMMVVMAIFVLLAGGIYATVNAAMRAMAIVTEENLQTQRLDAFVSLLRGTFRNLPAAAQFAGGVRVEDGEGMPEIVLRDAPGVFAWGAGGSSSGTVVLSARPRLGGGRELGVALLPGSLGDVERREALENTRWLRLVPDLREVQWRFYNEAQQDWVEEWPEGTERPPLVELSMQLLGEDAPRKFVFWLPPVKEQPAEALPVENAPDDGQQSEERGQPPETPEEPAP